MICSIARPDSQHFTISRHIACLLLCAQNVPRIVNHLLSISTLAHLARTTANQKRVRARSRELTFVHTGTGATPSTLALYFNINVIQLQSSWNV